MSGFAKLDSGIVNSTIWVQPHDVLRVWIALLAMANQDGVVRTAAPALAHLCMIPLDRMREILRILESPDEDSRSDAEEGRRLMKIEGGWWLVNYAEYRRKVSAEEKREADRVRIATKRGACRAVSRDVAESRALSKVSQTVAEVAQAEAEAEADADAGKSQEQVRSRGSRLPTGWSLPPEWRVWAQQERPDINVDREAASFADHWHAKAGKDGCKADWQATWRNWIRRAYKSTGSGRLSAVDQVMDNIERGARRLSVTEQIEQHIRAGQQHDVEPLPAIEGECWHPVQGGAL